MPHSSGEGGVDGRWSLYIWQYSVLIRQFRILLPRATHGRTAGCVHRQDPGRVLNTDILKRLGPVVYTVVPGESFVSSD